MADTTANIGVATMDEQGVITLLLRAEGPSGIVGDAVLTYERSNPDYQMVIEHVGGLEVGEEKPVPPWE